MSSGSIKVYHRCGRCEKKQVFINSGKFRVNDNGNRVDVRLIVVLGGNDEKISIYYA